MKDVTPRENIASEPEMIADVPLIERLFSDLFEKKIIYHERITILSELTNYEINNNCLDIWHKPIKLLYAGPFLDAFEHWQREAPLECGINLAAQGIRFTYRKGRLGGAYIPFVIWPDIELVKLVSYLSDEELERDLHRILWE